MYLLGLWCLQPKNSVGGKEGSFKAKFSTVAVANVSNAAQGPRQLSFTVAHALSPGGLC